MSKAKLEWDVVLEIINLLGETPSPAFLEIMEKEKQGKITKEELVKAMQEIKNEKV